MWARPSEVGGKEGLYKVYSSKTRLKGSRISWLGFHGCVEGLGWLGNLIGKGLRVYILWYKYILEPCARVLAGGAVTAIGQTWWI